MRDKLFIKEATKRNTVELTILIPCLNEAATLGLCIEEAQMFLQNNQIPGEVVVVDNGSTDDSGEIGQSRGARVVFCNEKGYGNALRKGFREAKGTYIIMGDGDGSYDFSAIKEMYILLQNGMDMVIGNRFAEGFPEKKAMPRLHRLGVPVLSMLGRMRFHCCITDFHCGLRGVRKASVEPIAFETTGMEFATEMIAKAVGTGLRIAETPVKLREDGRGRKSHLRPIRDGLRHLWVIIRGEK